MLGLTYVELEVVLIAKVDAVYPWRVNTVRLCVLTLVLAHVRIVVNEIHETLSIVVSNKTELLVSYLLIGWNVESIVVITITVDIVGQHPTVVVATTPSLIYEVVVVAALVVNSCRSHQTIGSYILRVVQTDVVWTLYRRNIGECRLSVRTWHTSNLLRYSVSISSHQTNPVGGLSLQLD